MGNKNWTRLVALCLAVVCTLTVVLGATELQFDKNGDGKTTVWDLQNVLKNDRANYEKAVSEALDGKGDELNPNSDNVYEIWTELGLRNMVKRAKDSCSFKLMADIDLGGKDWTPVVDFNGTLDGNGYAIRNVSIAKYDAVGDGYNQALFASTHADSVIKNVHVDNVSINANAVPTNKNNYIGVLVGTSRGLVQDCTTVGMVTDDREELTSTVFIGSLIGRNTATGTIKYTSEFADFLEVNSGATGEKNADDNVTGIASKLAMLYEPHGKRVVGLTGSPYNVNLVDENDQFTGNWQDISNSSDLVDEDVRARREEVARYMYEMCTVEWKVTQTMTYYKNGTATTTYSANDGGTNKHDVVYRGIPYNHGCSSLERFQGYMVQSGDQWVANHELLPSAAYYYNSESEASIASYQALQAAYNTYSNPETDAATKASLEKEWPELPLMDANIADAHQVGFNKYIGNDCSSAVDNAWRRVSSSVVAEGGAAAPWTNYFFPTEKVINTYGLRAVNGLSFAGDKLSYVNSEGETVEFSSGVGSSNTDKAGFLKQFRDNNTDYYYQTLAATSMGDMLVGFTSGGGHAILAAGDAVVIRDSKGNILKDKSYIVAHEQGANPTRSGSGAIEGGTNIGGVNFGGTRIYSSCAANYKWSFEDLSATSSSNPANSNYVFVPVSMDALHEKDTDAAKVRCDMEGGVITSNFHIVSTTVGEKTVYTQIKQSGHRYACLELTVAQAHPDVATGNTVKVLLSNGETREFTY